jgi:CDP-diacylglycerol--glycerol-3-phosphate 3-phosphatidyltransferase
VRAAPAARLHAADARACSANLSTSYFTDRQDRYVHLASPALAAFCAGFLAEAARWSYRLRAAASPHTLEWAGAPRLEGNFEAHAGARIRALVECARVESPDDPAADVRVLPVPQLGLAGVRDEERAVAALLRAPAAALTSGYFGLAPAHAARVLASPAARVALLCAAPAANGFSGARGVAGRIPEGYTLLEQRFVRAARAAGRGEEVVLQEWERAGWTYHAKGVWARPAHDAPPVATLLGSTNLSARSAERDAELSFVLLSGHKDVRRAMEDEVRGLWEHAGPWQGAERKVRLGTKALVGLVGGML